MQIDILTLFPEMFPSVLSTSILKRAHEKGLISTNLVNIRDYATNKHAQVDDYPYGGGAGMLLKVDIVGAAIMDIKQPGSHVIYMSPQGETLRQKKLEKLISKQHLVILCGHYEGIDERILSYVDEEISIGDYVLTGGEIPAMVMIDAIVRLLPGVLGQEASSVEESFTSSLLEYPQYTRPAAFEDQEVPAVLTSGNHEEIRLWRKKQSLLKTLLKRPDLFLKRSFSAEEKGLLLELLFSGEKNC